MQVLPEGEQPIKLEIQLTKAGKKRKQKLHDIEQLKKDWDLMTEGLTMDQVKDALNQYKEQVQEFDSVAKNVMEKHRKTFEKLAQFDTKEYREEYTQKEYDSLPHIKLKTT